MFTCEGVRFLDTYISLEAGSDSLDEGGCIQLGGGGIDEVVIMGAIEILLPIFNPTGSGMGRGTYEITVVLCCTTKSLGILPRKFQ